MSLFKPHHRHQHVEQDDGRDGGKVQDDNHYQADKQKDVTNFVAAEIPCFEFEREEWQLTNQQKRHNQRQRYKYLWNNNMLRDKAVGVVGKDEWQRCPNHSVGRGGQADEFVGLALIEIKFCKAKCRECGHQEWQQADSHCAQRQFCESNAVRIKLLADNDKRNG